MTLPDRLDGVAQARLVAHGEITAAELVEATIARIEALNPAINAVVSRRYERALGEARAPRPGPFSGVPLLLKELTAFPDWPSTQASVAFRDAPPGAPTVFTRRLLDAGFIVLGRTNSSEFGALPTTRPDLFGPTRNPWSHAHDPGGSSGGAAAAVAAGMVPLAQGGDGGGSLRIPASACGVFGFKPSRGRISSAPAANPDGGGVHHVITRTVRDSAAVLDATKGPSPGDRWVLPPEPGGYLDRLDEAPPRLRVALAPDGFMARDAAHPQVRAAVIRAGEQLSALGHAVDEARPQVDAVAVNEAFLTGGAIAAARVVAQLSTAGRPPPRDSLGKWTWGMAEIGVRLPPYAHAAALETLQVAAYRIAAFQSDYDVILTPVLHRPPLRIGELEEALDFPELRQAMLAYSPHTPVANATGQPAMSLPLAVSPEGLPIGVQVMGRLGEDGLLLRLARQLEAAGAWDPWRYP